MWRRNIKERGIKDFPGKEAATTNLAH